MIGWFQTKSVKIVIFDNEQNHPFCRLKLLCEKFGQYKFEPTNQISIKVPKVFEPINKIMIRVVLKIWVPV